MAYLLKPSGRSVSIGSTLSKFQIRSTDYLQALVVLRAPMSFALVHIPETMNMYFFPSNDSPFSGRGDNLKGLCIFRHTYRRSTLDIQSPKYRAALWWFK
jgi:hypothetical protein